MRKRVHVFLSLANVVVASTASMAGPAFARPFDGPAQPSVEDNSRSTPSRGLEVVFDQLLGDTRHVPDAHFADQPTTCLTPFLVDLYRHRNLLAPEIRAALEASAGGSALPPSVGSVSSEVYPIRVHYPSDGYEARAAEVVGLAEHAWETEVTGLGFSAPLPDGGVGGDDSLDIYLASYDLTAGGAYTQPSYWDTDPSDDVQACSSYIILYQDLDETVLPVYVAHEFNHATQCAMDFREITWAWETTATFMEDVVYDDINDYYRYIPYFQAYPEQTLVYFDTMPPYALYPYGATIFIHFLDEALGTSDGRVAARLWIDSEQPGMENEPDFIDAIGKVADENGWRGVDDAYSTFSLWRFLVSSNDDGHHFEEGADWNATASGQGSIPPVRFELSTADLPAEGDLTNVCTLGTSYIVIDVEHHDEHVSISAETSSDTRLGLAASRLYDTAPSQDALLSPESPTQTVRGTFETGSADRILLSFVNLGSSDYDPDTSTTDSDACVSIHVTIALEDTGGCSGCDQTPGDRGLFPLMLVVLIFVSRRAILGGRRSGQT